MTQPKISAEQFEREYAERSGVTVESLHAEGRRARPCRCEYEKCQGWQMLSDENWDDREKFQAGVIDDYPG